MRQLIVFAVAAAVAGGCHSGPDVRKTYPVSGTVTINGAPAEDGVIVTLVPQFTETDKYPIHPRGRTTGGGKFKLTTYNYLIFGIVLVVMMIKRPEGLFPDESAKAEMHGVGISAEVTGAADSELVALEELEVVQLEEAPLPDPNAPAPDPPAKAGPESSA